MLKKVILSVFIGFIVVVLALGFVFFNLKSNSVYYAQHTPHKVGVEPVLMEVTRNLDWIYSPDIKGIKYDYDGYRNIYNNKYGRDEGANFAYLFSEEYSYDDGNFSLYTFDKRFRLISVWNEKTLEFTSKPVDVSAVKRDIYRVVQPVIDAQPEPLINLQWIYDWVNKDRFN
ncbi:hypothetical protein [uncultured Varibaculum sp.]|uniref:hypothetical protein n=1 Tax=uncultured Varibaculum sp. TaxID=413896 RepID=UPI00258F9E8D|nr:hypothetical protein [uncultured Varibaculum sp.]